MTIEINNVKCHIHSGGADNLIGDMIEEVREYLSVPKQGSFFAQKNAKYKVSNRVYFCTPTGKFPTGFLPYVYQYLKTFEGLKINLVDNRDFLLPFSNDLDMDVVHFELMDHQKDSVRQCNRMVNNMYWPRGIIDAATNAGKNSVIAGIAQNIIGNDATLMVLHNKDIKDQAIEFFGEIFDVGVFHKNKREINKPFVIAMAKTLYNAANKSVNIKRWLSTRKVLFVDESHVSAGHQYSRLLIWVNAGHRYLVSGTPLDMNDPKKKMMMIGNSGDIIYKISNMELIDKGVSNNVEVHMYPCIYDPYLFDVYEDAYNALKTSMNRVYIIKKYLMENPDRQVLINVKNYDHGEFIYNQISSMCNCRLLFGKSAERSKLIEEFKEYKYRVVITTILKEGINAGIDTLIYACGGKETIRLKQYIGRVLRKKGKYDTSHVIDFFDRNNYCDKHSRARIRIYKKEGFPLGYHYKPNRFGSIIL